MDDRGKGNGKKVRVREETMEKIALLMNGCGAPCDIAEADAWMRKQSELDRWCERRCGNVPEWRCWKVFFMVRAGIEINKKKRKKTSEEKAKR